jgi:hypothetical protein
MAGSHQPALPERFRDLEEWARAWAIEREIDRTEKRLTSSMPQIEAFYAAVMPRMDEILVYLNDFPLENMPDSEARLLWLTLSLAEIAPAMHFYGQPTVVDGFDVHSFRSFDVPHFSIPGDHPGSQEPGRHQ